MKKTLKNIHKKVKKPMGFLIFVVFLSVAISTQIVYKKMADKKIVVSLYTEYQKNGYPVYAKKLSKENTSFLKIFSLNKKNNNYIAWLDKKDLKNIKIGDVVYYKDIKGKVIDKNETLDYLVGLYKLTIKFNVPIKEKRIKANIEWAEKTCVTIENKFITCNGFCYVWQIQDRIAIKTKIITGIKDDEKIEIVSDINLNYPVIISSANELEEGLKVKNYAR